MPRKKHWTQTPQGRKRLSEMATKRHISDRNLKASEIPAVEVEEPKRNIEEHPFERGYRNGIRIAFSSVLRRIADALQDC